MKAEEAKALSLFRKFYSEITGIPITSLGALEPYNSRDFNLITAKDCALIAVDEILQTIVWHNDFNDEKRTYWQEVKQHLTNL